MGSVFLRGLWGKAPGERWLCVLEFCGNLVVGL